MPEHQRSCLDLVEQQFLELSTRPSPVAIDGESLHGALPQRPIPIGELRVTLLKHACRQVKDIVWAQLVRLKQTHADPWTIAAAGMMIPGLKRLATRFRPSFPGDPRDLDSEILEAFLHALGSADPNRPGLSTHLYGAALRRAHQACKQERRQACEHLDFDDTTECPCAGNPDLALAQAVLDGVVTISQANLVCGVHLDCARRGEVARRLGIGRDRARRELATARRGLSAYLIAA